jgi:hypothetical protein
MNAGFHFAPASERTLSAGDYLLGVLELLVILAPLAWAAWRIRGSILPAWTGAPARLAESVLGLSILIPLAELVGTFGAFTDAGMIVGSLVVGVGAHFATRASDGASATRSSPHGREKSALRGGGAAAVADAPKLARELSGSGVSRLPAATPRVLAALACAALAAAWMVPTLAALAGGMDRADTLWYHMPLSTKFVQTGSLGDIYFFDPIFFASFYPANSEVLHAVPILAFGRDIVSPLLNLGFLALGLVAAWCIGRPYGLGPHALIGGSIALGAQMLIEFQAGEALNDIVGVAFVLATVALLVNAYASRAVPEEPPREPLRIRASHLRRIHAAKAPSGALAGPALAVAGLAAGLAAGTKLSFLAPVGALLVGLVVIAPRGARWWTGTWFAVPALLTGGYWFLRNLVAVGNPIPYISSLGPIDLPAPERNFELRPGFSVSHYWNDFDVWSDWFFPGLEESFGFLWPLTLAVLAGGAAYALWRGGEPLLRMLGAVVLFTVVAYLFTPLTAAGEEGEPIAFEWNVRYIAPAAAVGLALVPTLPQLRETPQRRTIVLASLSVLLAVTVASLVQWQQGHVKGAVAAGIGVLLAAGAIAWLRSRGLLGPGAPRRVIAGLAVVLGLGALGAGWWEQNHYLERRYENTSPELKLADALRWARDLRGAKVAVSGVRGVFNQYPFYGTDLSNEVQWLGIKGEHDAWLRIPDCETWRQQLADGDYTHVVTTYDPFNPGDLEDTKEGLWTREDPAAREIADASDGPVSVFELRGEPDPAACDGLPELTEAELNGDSVNIAPSANEPR